MKTSELLILSNALWLSIDKLGGDKFHEDRLYELLAKIQPKIHPSVQEDPSKKKTEDGGRRRGEDGAQRRTVEDLQQRGQRLWHVNVLAGYKELKHRFVINHRFLENDRDICFCRKCDAPVLRRFAPEEQRNRRELRLIQVYKPKQGKQVEKHYPFRDLEAVLARKGKILQSGDFTEIRLQLEDVTKNLLQSINQKSQGNKSDDYDFLNELESSKKALDLLRNNGIQKEEFFDHIIDSYMMRVHHNRYLGTLDAGLAKINERLLKYKEETKKRIDYMQKFVEISDAVWVPSALTEQGGPRLKLMDIQRKKRTEERKVKGFDGGVQTLYPSGTYCLGTLIAKKVVRSVDSRVPSDQQRFVYFTFSLLETDDWAVLIVHKDNRKSHMLCTFTITRSEVDQMQRAGKAQKRDFNDGFVVMSCFSLVQLLARIRAMDFTKS